VNLGKQHCELGEAAMRTITHSSHPSLKAFSLRPLSLSTPNRTHTLNRTHTHTHAHTHACTHAHMHMRAHTHTQTHTHTHTHTYTIHTNTHIPIHTYTLAHTCTQFRTQDTLSSPDRARLAQLEYTLRRARSLLEAGRLEELGRVLHATK